MSEHAVSHGGLEAAGLVALAALAAAALLVVVLVRRATPQWFGMRLGWLWDEKHQTSS